MFELFLSLTLFLYLSQCHDIFLFNYNYALSHLVIKYYMLVSEDDFHTSTLLTVRSYGQLNCLYICMYVTNYELNIV